MNASHPLRNAPWISVVVPARDAATTIESTLDSLAAQTEPDWEAIVVDDSSSDDTAAIVARYAAADPRIRLISVRAGGASAARNAGLALATGERVLFLDSDDWIADNHLQTMRRVLAQAPAGSAAYCAFEHVDEDGKRQPKMFEPRIEAASLELFARECGAAIHCIVLDRALVVELGGFDVTLRTCEDWELWYRVARSGVRFVGVDQALSFYRIKPGSLTTNAAQMIADGTTVLTRAFRDAQMRQSLAQPGQSLAQPGQSLAQPGQSLAQPGMEDPLATLEHELRVALYYVWFATIEVARGKPGAHLLLPLASPPRMLSHITRLAELMIDALITGAACSGPELAARFAAIAEPFAELLAQLERSCDEPGLARALTYNCERRILHLSGLHTPTVLGGLMFGARVDLRRPIDLRPPPGVDMMYLLLCDGAKVLGNVDIPVLEPGRVHVDREELLLEALGPRAYLRRGRLARRPRILAYFLGYAARRTLRHTQRVLRGQPRPRRIGGELSAAAYLALHRAGGRLPARGVRARTWAAIMDAPSSEITVLMYHTVADSGPADLARCRVTPAAFEAQMRLLHERGYRCLSSRALGEHLARDEPFTGKPIVITFDGGYTDFQHSAWPILRRFDLSAEVFVATDLVGRTSSSDAASGPPAALMDWDAIRELSRQGVNFGSHLATHRRADTLASVELAAEFTRSRTTLEVQLGKKVTAIAAPFGYIDSRYMNLAHKTGFEIGYSTVSGVVSLGAMPLALCRVEVRGDLDLDGFAKLLEAEPGRG